MIIAIVQKNDYLLKHCNIKSMKFFSCFVCTLEPLPQCLLSNSSLFIHIV